MLTLAEIRDARAAIADRIYRTPLLSARQLGERTGTRCFIKAEQLQRTGSFKVRGALNKVRSLSPEERARGLLAVSAGNHAQGVAFAGAAFGASVTVVMPGTAPRSKIEASRGYGADVILHGTLGDAFRKGQELQAEKGYTVVHPYDDPLIIAGQGTIGLEILEDLPDVDAVVVPVGGGGLIAGIAAAVKFSRPEVRVIGVEPEGATKVIPALQAGAVVDIGKANTIADGLATPRTGEHVLEHVRALVDDLVIVTDDEIVDALLFLLERSKLLVEPAGAAAAAALLAGKVNLPEGACVVTVASGGNVDLMRLAEVLPR